MKAGRILEGLREAAAGHLGRIHIFDEDTGERQAWVKETPLIAAAPELLEALKDATFALALLAGSDEGHEKYLNAARAAIAKAEGKSE